MYYILNRFCIKYHVQILNNKMNNNVVSRFYTEYTIVDDITKVES